MSDTPQPADLHAIVLAAGAGRRFGGGKMLADWNGAPLLHAALAAACAAPVESVVVVTGCNAVDVANAARAYECWKPLHIVEAPNWAEGLSASLRAGVAALPADTGGAFIFLGDMPRVPGDVPAKLAEALRAGADAAAPTCHGRRGHPVLLGRAILQNLPSLSGDRGARDLLTDREVSEVQTAEEGVLFDVDLPLSKTP